MAVVTKRIPVKTHKASPTCLADGPAENGALFWLGVSVAIAGITTAVNVAGKYEEFGDAIEAVPALELGTELNKTIEVITLLASDAEDSAGPSQLVPSELGTVMR
ncbi:uncharacterized protein K441DRAFT_670207 [Cenococcum geophilum 1.58]|uniref:Uncharacterized protein n=1 Tax=Cenococcum geophilum 1.58 TaxID=794803 RepID=A0ACC8EN45_9PEZI|nr:hypothetical protein K441DRAFT_670207 [Cenococcum geophilum 1.58]